MIYIKKKLIPFYKNKDKQYIITKDTATKINNDVVGKCFIVYNGNKWIKKPVDNYFFVGKSIGMFRGLETRAFCVFKSKKDKKKKNKNNQKKKKKKKSFNA